MFVHIARLGEKCGKELIRTKSGCFLCPPGHIVRPGDVDLRLKLTQIDGILIEADGQLTWASNTLGATV